MAAKGISLHKVPQFPMTLASAALEWLLIFLLFIHAIFSYSITKFARYCNLQIPCLLCSRLDHVLGSEKLGFYWDLICRHHKLEISSLVVCHVHNNLVDVHGMCENCLFSFATINKSNAETYRLLVGKLGENSPGGDDESPFEDNKHGDFSKRICSCCNEPYILRNHAENLLQNHFDFDDSKNNRKERTPLPYVEYSKVKNFSDTESEIPFSDDDDGLVLIRESKRDFIIETAPMVPRVITQPDDLISEKLILTDSVPEFSLLDMPGEIGNNDPEASKYTGMLEEIRWLHVEPKVDSSIAATNSENLDDTLKSSDVVVTQNKESKLCVEDADTADLYQTSSKSVTYEETSPVIEQELSSEITNAENAKVSETVQLEKITSENATVEETRVVLEREASPEIQSDVNNEVTETIKMEPRSTEKDNSEEIKPVIEREASPEIQSVVNNEVTETIKSEQISTEKDNSEEIKPVIEREASPEIQFVVNNEIAETIKSEKINTEKDICEEIKPVVEHEASPEIQSVVNNEVAETIKSEKINTEKDICEEIKPVVEHEASPEIQSVVNNEVAETIKLEKINTEKDICEETKPVLDREASREIPAVLSDNITEKIEIEQQTVIEKGTHEEIKPIIERETSPELQSVVNDKVSTETFELKQINSENVTHEEIKPVIERGPSSEIPSVINDSITQVPDNLEIGEAYKLAVGNNRRQFSGKLFEQRSLKDSNRISEDFKLLLSQISTARGIDLPFEFSPRISGNIDESVVGTQRKIILERNESGLSLDGSFIGEIEGESEVDRLKRQVEHDKKLMSALFKELEEERNASGIAANQAMAMITRLQEEKASLQMEALQCVRMMEEQAEYDVEALQKANDLLAEKEKEIQDLEADLEFFRNKLENISMFERECGLESREFMAEQSDSNNFKNSENVESNSTVDKPSNDLIENSFSNFEDERLYILEGLRKLEKKLYLFSDGGVKEDKDGDLNEPNCKEETQEISSISRILDTVDIGDAISNLIKRLEALEADRNGIDHSLTRGDEEGKLQSEDSSSSQGSDKE